RTKTQSDDDRKTISLESFHEYGDGTVSGGLSGGLSGRFSGELSGGLSGELFVAEQVVSECKCCFQSQRGSVQMVLSWRKISTTNGQPVNGLRLTNSSI